MKKNTQYIIIIMLIIIAAATIYIGTGGNFATVGGINTLSVSSAELKSDFGPLNGQAWLVTFAQGVQQQQIYGTVTPESIGAKTGDDRPEKSFTFKATYDKQQCTSKIRTNYNAESIDRLGYVEYSCFSSIPTESNARAALNDKGISEGNLFAYGKNGAGIFTGGCYAIYVIESSTIGDIQTPSAYAKINMELNVDGKTSYGTIETNGRTETAIGDYAYATWNGNLVVKNCEAYGNRYRAAWNGATWKVISSDSYNSYLRKSDTLDRKSIIIQSYITYDGEEYNTRTQWKNFVSAWNSVANAATSDSRVGTIDQAQSQTSARLLVEQNDIVQSPVITLAVKASKIGIYTPVSKIKVIKSYSNMFKAGDDGTIIFELENTGDEDASWNVYTTCTNGFVADRTDVSIDAGERTTLYVDIGVQSSSKVSGDCETTFERPGDIVKVNTKVSADPIRGVCSSNQLQCSSIGGIDAIFKCNSDGTSLQEVERCDTGEYCKIEGLGPKCVSKDGGSGAGLNSALLVVTILIGLIGGIYVYAKSDFVDKVKYGNYIRVALGIIVFIAVLFIVPTIWRAIVGLFTI